MNNITRIVALVLFLSLVALPCSLAGHGGDGLVQRGVSPIEDQDDLSGFPAFYAGFKALAEGQHIPRPQAASGLCKGPEAVRRFPLVQSDLRQHGRTAGRPGRTSGGQPRWNNLGIIK